MRQRSHAGGFRALRLSTMVILFVGVIGLSSSLLPQTQLTSSTTATTLYASATATGTGTCATAANACTLGTALRDVDPGDTIDLVTPGTSGSYDGTFTVATSGTSASYPITIQPAPGVANPTLNGQSKGSVLIIGGGVYVNLTGVTITGGHAGTSGDSPITNGGGIYNIGTLTVTDSTISQNFAFFDGGGMYSSGTATIIDSTISDNIAGLYGGGIYNASTTTIIHSTISGDVSRYGAGAGRYGAGAGIYNLVGTVNLAADLLATVGGPPSGGECAGTITDLGYNVADDSSCHFTNSTSVVSTSADKLGPLANNGGPTETILPLSGNPAIGLIPPTTSVAINGTHHVTLCPTTDQRGATSPSDANCDAGSVQLLVTTLYASATATGTGTCATAANACTLGTALRDVYPNGTIDLVTPGTSGSYDGTFTVATSGTSASYPVTIQPAPGVVNPTLNGQRKGPVLTIGRGVYVNLTGVTITGGNSEAGGGIDNTGTLAVGDSTISNNASSGAGGGIYNADTLTVTDSTISNNTASTGGGIDTHGTLTLTDSTINANVTSLYGGGIDNTGTLTVIDSTISNDSSLFGGGIYNFGNLIAIHSTISGDAVSHYGAGIYSDSGAANLAADLLATKSGPPTGGECAGTITDLGYNVADDSTCFTASNTVHSVVSTSTDTLGSLANNGGPTETILPLSGNPAIGLIPPTTSVAINGTSVALCPTTDQRGVASPSGANCDAGSVEVLAQTIHFTSTAPTHPIVVSSTYTPTASSTSGLPVTITIASTSSSVCSINTSGVVTFTASGTCVIDANQAGNTTYLPAPEVTQSISVVGPPTPIPTHPSPVSKPASTLDTVPNAAITYPNGALIQSGQQIDVIAGGYAFGIPTPAMMNKITKADTSTVVTGTFPTTTTPTPGTLINPVGTPGYWVVGTNGEIYAFSSMSQFTSDGYLLSQVVPVPNTGGLVVHAGTPPTAAMTMANGALVQYGTTIYEYAGQVPTGIQTPAQLAEIQRITGAVVLKGSGTTPTAATTSANGTLVHPLGTDGIWVSDGHVLYQFTSPSQFTTDGYASRYVLPVATLGTYTKSAI